MEGIHHVPSRDQPVGPLTNKQKKRGISGFTLAASIILALIVGMVLGSRSDFIATYILNKPNQGELDLSSLQQTYKKLKADYDGRLNPRTLVEGANRGLVEASGDQYTAYFNKKEAAEFNDDLEGTFSGIGAELDKKEGRLVIVSALDNSPAQKAGIKAGDIIAKVNDENTSDWPIDKAVSRIKGEKGTTVKLTVLRSDEVKEFSITRAIISDPSVKTEEKGSVGIIRISRFGSDTASLTRKAAATFKEHGIKSVVLDLRGNGGGYLEVAQDVASLWLESGQVVVTERRGETVTQTHKASGDPVFKGTPTIVLIDGGSASASEIVAGALQDHTAATLVGEKSFGKGSVQKLVDLSGGAKLKITIAKWYTPKGKNISKNGINPNVTVAVGTNDTKNNDTQLNKALELISP